MSHNNFTYCICPKAQFDDWEAKGMGEGNTSTSGEWRIGGKPDKSMYMFDVTGLPQWIQDILDDDTGYEGCCMSHEAVSKIDDDPRWWEA